MSNRIVQRLLNKTGNENLLPALDKLSLSELNSVLMEIFRIKANKRSVKDLLHSYQHNRFVLPSEIDPVDFMKMEIRLLERGKENGFRVMELSPLAPLGSCSTFALADQNKIVSALRGTEVVADATNVLAINSALERIHSGFDANVIHYCAAHRHVRAQTFSGKGFSAHFKIFCAVSSGKDTGGFTFERQALLKHFSLYRDFLIHTLNLSGVKIIIKALMPTGEVQTDENSFEDRRLSKVVYEELKDLFNDKNISLTYEEVQHNEHRYYHMVRFSVNIQYKNNEFNLGDGGFVDWPEKLTNNKKERMLTSGLGTEFLFKLLNGKVI